MYMLLLPKFKQIRPQIKKGWVILRTTPPKISFRIHTIMIGDEKTQ